MVKKFVIKPWMIIVASVVVIGGVALFFVLNKNPTDNKSSPSVNKKSYISPQDHNDYWSKTNKKREEATNAEEQCKQEDHPTEERKYKSCDEKEEVEAADEEVEKEKVKEEKKTKKPMTQSRLKALRKKYQKQAKKLVSTKRRKGIPYCAAGGKKGDTNQNGYKMMKYGCKECEDGHFLDEDGKCQSSAAECNDPRHIADENGQLITDDMADKLLKEEKGDKKQKLKCICPHIHPSAQGSMYQYKDGICQRRVKTKDGKTKDGKTKDGNLVYKNFLEEGDVPYYATNEQKKKAFKNGILHPDFLKDPNFYQEQEEGKNNLSLPMDGSFFKIVDGKIVKTEKTDKDKTLSYYAGVGVFCYPNDPDKNSNKALCTSNLSGVSGVIDTDNQDLTKKQQIDKVQKAFTKDNLKPTSEIQEARDYKGNVIKWDKNDPFSRGNNILSREDSKYTEEINDMMKNKGVVEGKFYKKVDNQIKETKFSDTHESVFYINAGRLCYPNKGADKNVSRFCGNTWFNKDTGEKVVTKSNFVITPECVF